MNQLKTLLLLGILTALLVGIGSALAPGSLHFFVLLAVLMNVGAYFFSDKLVLAMHRAQPVSEQDSPRLHAIINELSLAAGIPKPKLYRIPAPYANAFATGRNPQHGVVAVTDGILNILGERELKGVLAHEIAHIKNRDILIATIAATIAAGISSVANAIQFGALFGGRSDEEGDSGGSSLLMAFIAPIAATLLQLGISRSREFAADETAAKLTKDPRALASALERLHQGTQALPTYEGTPATASLFIVNPFTGMGGLASLFSTHPPMERRIERLLSMHQGVYDSSFKNLRAA